MNFLPRRIALKLIFSLTLIVIFVEGISGFINVKTQERQLLDAMILGADQLSKSITSATWQAMRANHRAGIYEVMTTIAQKQGISRIRIFNKEGRVMFTTLPGDESQVDKRAEACALCHAASSPLVKVDVPSRSRIFNSPTGARQLGIITPIYNEPACSQAACHAHPATQNVLGVLDVVLDLSTVDNELSAMQYRVILVTVVEVLLTAIIIILLTRKLLDRPIHRLIEATRAVSAMRLDKPVDVRGSEELEELARSFNIMRERLNQSIAELNQFNQSLESKVAERTEQLRSVNQKLMHTDRLTSLGQLSASVAHEINNPLSGVLNLSMLMQRILKDDGIPPERVPEFHRYLAQVTHETSRVGRIVSDLLAFSRRSKPQSTQADLNAIVTSTVSLLSHKMKLAGVEIALDLRPDLPHIQCDASQMQQVVMNLVMNAAEACHGGGRVQLRTRVLDDLQTAELEVTDNGEGIAPENLPKIFDPFFTTKGEGKGVGLGLAVVFGIIQSHGGDIDVRSSPGAGTTFTIVLPLHPEHPPDVTHAPVVPHHLS